MRLGLMIGSGVLVAMLGACAGKGQSSPKPSDAADTTAPETQTPMLTLYKDSKFAPGQVWKFAGKNASGRLVILRVERARQGDIIVHAAVDGLEIVTSKGTQTRIAHLPFAREAVEASATELTGKAELPPYEEGYSIWREAFVKGKGGVFTVSVDEAVTFVGESMAPQR